ncbi:MAG: ATP-binding protein [Verrucomicrobiota bacterium]
MGDPEKHKHFSGLLAEELQSVAQTAEVRFYKAGDPVFKEGDPGDGLYVVLEGLVQVSALVGQEQRKVLSRIGPGDFFGEMAVLDNEPRSATATAEKDTRAFFIQRQNLLSVLESSPQLSVSLVREFSLRMREFNRKYIEEVLQAERLTLVGRFARTIVHDFKNPLNVIGLAAELAGMEKATPEMRKAAQARIRRQVDRLSNMINELLEFTRGSQTANVLAETNYAQYVNVLVEEIRPEVAEKRVSLDYENEPPQIRLLLDPHRLTHVFYNLIHNAVDEMPNGGKIILRFQLTDTEVITEIEDSGKGIAPEIAGRLFEPFATFGKAQGTGLGLSICKRIIDDHRGVIRARSEPGRGAVFSFSLPLKR